MIKITKFGGSSVANAAQFRKVKDIILSDPSRRFVVVSAAGKGEGAENKITDLLYICHAHVKYHVDYKSVYAMIRQRFADIIEELSLDSSILAEIDRIGEKLPEMSLDELVSRGEYITSLLMADYLDFPFVDAADVIRFNFDGSINFDVTTENLNNVLKKHDRFVLPGFYGSYMEGTIKIMSRGGSDVTGSILAKCLNADLYENWTDVSGFLMADPRIVKDPRHIDKITYTELRELSYMGASVLHEDAVFPVKEANIPINILNTNCPEDKGTIIQDVIQPGEDEPIITGIAGKKGFCSFNINKPHLSDEVGFIRRILSVFEKYNVSIEHIPSGIDSVCILVKESDVANIVYDIIAEIKEKVEPESIKFVDGIALVATVGRNMSNRSGTSGRLFSGLGNSNINVQFIIQSSDEINILVGIANEDYEEAIRAIYNAFME